MAVVFPENEAARMDALRRCEILDTPAEPAYDDLVSLAAQLGRAPMAFLSFADGDRLWFKARLGIEPREMPREQSFCAQAVLAPDDLLLVPDTRMDQRFAKSPWVTEELAVRAYAGAPLTTPKGLALGTLALLDRVPRKFEPEQLTALRTLARQVMHLLELRAVAGERQRAEEERRRYEAKLEAQQRKLEESLSHLEVQSTMDSLTGLHNRRSFEQRLEEELYRAERYQQALGLLLVDVDRFKAFNDAFGQVVGDAVLQDLAQLLLGRARGSDFVARFGGEEFALILPNTPLEGSFALAERCRRAVEMIPWDRRPLTVSIGVATLTLATRSSADLLADANQALYHAKRNGRNSVADANGPRGSW